MDRERFDSLARFLATPGSRRAALAALFGAGAFGTIVDALARKKNDRGARKNRGGGGKKDKRQKNEVKASSKGNRGNSACANWCHDNFDGSAAGQCTAAAAKGEGPCHECGPQADPDNGFIFCDGACVEGECCTDAQCENPTPVCDDNTCVACTDDDQCGQDGICTCGGNVDAGQCQGDFFQGFEEDTAGWTVSLTRVASGTDGIPARTGGFYAKSLQGASDFTRWGGYSSAFPAGGYTTELAVYLDPPSGPADAQFDYSSAINQPNCDHRRDFIFSVGKRGGNPDYCVSASNNTPGNPCDPGRNAVVLTETGWYLFRHIFRDDGGILAVDMKVEDPSGIEVYSSTLSTPTDVIGSTVGGNRYGWIVLNDFSFIAIDDSSRSS